MEAMFLYIFLFLLTLLLATKLRFSFFTNRSSSSSSKRYPPTPPSLPIIGHLHLLDRPLHHALSRLSARHGCGGPVLLLRLGVRPVLVVSSLSAAEECFTTNDVAFANRPRLPSSKYLSYGYTTLGAANYGPLWRDLRRIATLLLLSPHRLASSSASRATEVRSTVRRLFKDSSPARFQKAELKSRLLELALNNMTMMMAGKRYYGGGEGTAAEEEEATRFRGAVEAGFKLFGGANIIIGDFLPFLGWIDFRGSVKKIKKLGRLRDEFLQDLIDGLRITKKDECLEPQKTMIGDLLKLQKTDPEYYSDRMIKSLLITLIVGGTDTTSNTIEWAMALLLNNPDKLKKAQAEIDECIGNGRLMQESDLSDLPYLQCVVTETLRLYPAGALLVPHESSKECVVGGYDIPQGTMLLVHAYSIHRDPKDWVEPTKFEPERFLDANGEGIRTLPFGMGRRRCPGKGLADRFMCLVLGTMIQCFDWKRVGEEPVDMTEGSGLTMPKVVPLEAMYRPRETMIGIMSHL